MDQNVKCKTVKLLEENMVENLHGLGFGDGYWDITSKAWSTSEKIAKVDVIKVTT